MEKRNNKKSPEEKKIQVGIKLGKKSIGDIKVKNGIEELDKYLKDLDPNHKR